MTSWNPRYRSGSGSGGINRRTWILNLPGVQTTEQHGTSHVTWRHLYWGVTCFWGAATWVCAVKVIFLISFIGVTTFLDWLYLTVTWAVLSNESSGQHDQVAILKAWPTGSGWAIPTARILIAGRGVIERPIGWNKPLRQSGAWWGDLSIAPWEKSQEEGQTRMARRNREIFYHSLLHVQELTIKSWQKLLHIQYLSMHFPNINHTDRDNRTISAGNPHEKGSAMITHCPLSPGYNQESMEDR
jgi:hypothetical protein